MGDVAALAESLRRVCAAPPDPRSEAAEPQSFATAHDWRSIARNTLGVYLETMGGRVPGGAGGR